MLKAILFNFLFIGALISSVHAEVEVVADNLNKDKPKSFSLNGKTVNRNQSLSLRSGMYFKGENLINSESAAPSPYVILNNISFEKGQNSYLMPPKKKAILNKITFNPNELLRNYSNK